MRLFLKKTEKTLKAYKLLDLVFFSTLVLGLIVFFKFDFFEENGELIFHGPHFGTSLSEFLQSHSSDTDLTLITKDRNSKQNSSDKTSTTSIQTTATTLTQLAANDSGLGIAAGGGLIGLNQSDLNSYFSNLKKLGVTWVRWDIDWGYVQPDNAESYVWDEVDRVANTAKGYGIKSLGIITYAPQWAAAPSCGAGKHCPAKDPSAFAYFAGVVTARYKGTISAWEIWNEPNIPSFWSPKPDLGAYGNLLKLAYLEIKRVDPQAFVLSGGLAAAADVKDGSISPITFITGLYNLRLNNYFDGVALHPYTYPVSPNYVAPWNSWQQMYVVKDVMASNGESSKKIWITEYGAPTGGPDTERGLDTLSFIYGSDYMSEAAQNDMAGLATQIYSQDKAWMGPLFWYSLRDNGADRSDPENFFGLIRYDGSKKPAYDSIKTFLASFKN